MLRKFTIFIFINDNLYYFSKRGSLGTTTDNSFIEDAYFPSIYSSPNSQQHFILIIFKNINRIFHETDAHLLPFYARRAGEIIKFFSFSLPLSPTSEWVSERLENALKSFSIMVFYSVMAKYFLYITLKFVKEAKKKVFWCYDKKKSIIVKFIFPILTIIYDYLCPLNLSRG